MRGPCACPRWDETCLPHGTQTNRFATRTAQGPHPSPHPPLVPTGRRVPLFLHSVVKIHQGRHIRSHDPCYFVKVHYESLLRWLRMFLWSIRIAVRIMNSCLFKITRRAQACNWNFWLACAGDLLGQRFPDRGRSLKACAIATKYGVEILVTRNRPK